MQTTGAEGNVNKWCERLGEWAHGHIEGEAGTLLNEGPQSSPQGSNGYTLSGNVPYRNTLLNFARHPSFFKKRVDQYFYLLKTINFIPNLERNNTQILWAFSCFWIICTYLYWIFAYLNLWATSLPPCLEVRRVNFLIIKTWDTLLLKPCSF